MEDPTLLFLNLSLTLIFTFMHKTLGVKTDYLATAYQGTADELEYIAMMNSVSLANANRMICQESLS